MKKIIVILPIILSFIFSFKSFANDFDPTYYAENNPDVVATYGKDSESLYMHYITYGKDEGRFANKEEELKALSLKTSEKIIEVDKTLQTVTLFVNGEKVLSGPCVTGDEKTKHSTPSGEYTILLKKKGKRLKGPTWNVWVDYWMRFTDSAIGFHDASWRNEFGGNIYKTNGSHGCVNLPKDFVKELFNAVDVGTKVIVH